MSYRFCEMLVFCFEIRSFLAQFDRDVKADLSRLLVPNAECPKKVPRIRTEIIRERAEGSGMELTEVTVMSSSRRNPGSSRKPNFRSVVPLAAKSKTYRV